MGFWSWIGLAEKKGITELKSSVDLLIEENQLLREENKKLFEYITDSKNKCVDDIMQQLRCEREAVYDSLKVTCSEIQGLTETIDCIQSKIDELKMLQNTSYDEIVKSQKKFEDNKNVIAESFRIHQEMYLSSSENILEEMKKYDTELMNCLSRIQKQNDKIILDVLADKDLLSSNSVRLADIAKLSGNIDRKADSIEKIHSKVALLAESVQNLWTIMKAIWVDSVLSDIDSMG